MAVAANALTTLAAVKLRLDHDGSFSTTYDTFLEGLIDEVSTDLEAKCNRVFRSQTYTEYFDGNGTQFLGLRQGPLTSITSVNHVAYSDAGDGSRDETLTEVEEYQRLEGGLIGEGHLGLGWIERNDGSAWEKGQRNYKVVYVAGFATIPQSLRRWASYRVCSEFIARESSGLLTKEVADGRFAFMSPDRIDEAEQRAIGPYIVRGIY
jgi:hypothetical protein